MPADVDYVRCLSLLGRYEAQQVPADREQLIISCGRLVHNWLQATETSQFTSADLLEKNRMLYKQLVDPVLRTLGSDLANTQVSKAAIRAGVAELAGFKAIALVRDYSLRKAVKGDASKLAFEAISMANRLAPKDVRHGITKGYVYDKWPGLVPENSSVNDELLKLGQIARRLCKAPAYQKYLPNALGMITYAQLLNARELTSVEKRDAKLTVVHQMFEKIAEQTKSDSSAKENPITVLNHSTCLVELAFLRKHGKEALLKTAEELATHAINDLGSDPRLDLAEAYIKRGHAREDLAYYVCKREKYKPALDDFKRAYIEAGEDDQTADRARLARARCMVRDALDSPRQADQLTGLSEAAGLLSPERQRFEDPKQRLREQMWRGKALHRFAILKKTSGEKALRILADTARAARDHEPKNWLKYELDHLSAFRDLVAGGRQGFTTAKLTELANSALQNDLLPRSTGTPLLVGALFDVYVSARLGWAGSQQNQEESFRQVDREFTSRLAQAKQLCREAELELLYGRMECGYLVGDPTSMASLWEQYRTVADKASSTQRCYRASALLGDYFYYLEDYRRAGQLYRQTLEWLKPDGCRDSTERRQYVAEAAWRTGQIQIRLASSERDEGLINRTLQLLDEPSSVRADLLRHPRLRSRVDEERLDGMVKRLKMVAK